MATTVNAIFFLHRNHRHRVCFYGLESEMPAKSSRVGFTTNLHLRAESMTTPLEVSLLSEPVPISKATLGGHLES